MMKLWNETLWALGFAAATATALIGIVFAPNDVGGWIWPLLTGWYMWLWKTERNEDDE